MCNGSNEGLKHFLYLQCLHQHSWRYTFPVLSKICSAVGLLCDLLWSDPDKEVMGWGENDRGVSFTFGPEIVSKYLAKHDMDLICRAHQVSAPDSGCCMFPSLLHLPGFEWL